MIERAQYVHPMLYE